jgi:ribosomal-protein-alanine N-acetyltransferase
VLPADYAIRPLAPDDAPALAAAYDRNRAHLAPWEPIRDPSFFTADGQADVVARQLSLVRGGQSLSWVLTHGERIVGRANLNNIVRGVLSSGQLGYWVDHEHLGRGLAGEAVEHACRQAQALGLHRVEAGTMVRNMASQRVLVRCGFEQYGMAPKYLFLAGAWEDHNLYQRILHDEPPFS